jgi:PHP family Zn ribbon phosphoesterase
MKEFIADLHIHTCLSPCAELDMTPLRITQRAMELGLDIIAISDHNSARNVEAAIVAGHKAGIMVIPAMEITTREEAHVLGLFPSVKEALAMQQGIYSVLSGGVKHKDDWQVVVDEQDVVQGFEELLLMDASDIPLAALPQAIRAHGGLAIAAHVDRPAFSVMSQMGFVPEDIEFDAFEVMQPGNAAPGLMFHPNVPLIASSDAHHLEDIGRRSTVLRMRERSFDEIKLALSGQDGRGVTPRYSREVK